MGTRRLCPLSISAHPECDPTTAPLMAPLRARMAIRVPVVGRFSVCLLEGSNGSDAGTPSWIIHACSTFSIYVVPHGEIV